MQKPDAMDLDFVELRHVLGGEFEIYNFFKMQNDLFASNRCWCKNGYKRNASGQCVTFCPVIANPLPWDPIRE